MSRPLPLLACAFWLGALIADAEPAPEPLQLWVLAVAALALGAAAIERSGPRFAFAALAAAALALGASAGLVERRAYDSNPLRGLALRAGDSPVRLSGTVVGDGRSVDGEIRVPLDVDARDEAGGGRPSGRIVLRVQVPTGGSVPTVTALSAGQRVTAWARLRLPVNARQAGAFDVEALYRRDGLHAAGTVKSARLLEVAPGEVGLAAALATVRTDMRTRIERHVRPGPATALTLAMVLGDRAALDDELEEGFRRAGTYHVLALSGAQVAFVAALIVAVATRLGLGPVAQLWLAAPAVLLYALLVGADVPVMRAAFGTAVVLFGRALDQRAEGLHLLAVAALAWLVGAPAQAGDLGCQLSFLATAGLVVLTRPLARRMPWGGLAWGLAVTASIAAQWALLPLAVARFHRLALLAPLLNLVAVPLATGLLGLGALTWACDVLAAPLAPLAGAVTSACADLLLASSRWVPEGLDPRLPAPAAWAVLLHFGALGVLAFVPRRERAGLLLLASAAVGLLLPHAARPLGVLRITALEVGHGDAILIELPGGERWMVDAGGGAGGREDRGFGERVLGPALWARGVARIDGLVLTHAHPDHAGGAGFLVRAFGAETVFEGPLPPREPASRRLASDLAGTRRSTVVAGTRLPWPGVTVDVLGPARPRRPPWRVRNDDSLVLRLRFGRHCVLLTGDAEAAAEAQLAPGRCDVLKVGHHGSRTSTGSLLLAELRPGLALISAGRRDLFGHPHPEVLARLRAQRALVLQTPVHGAIGFETDGSVLRVHATAPP
ncbi:MAG: DNA internalization-related competence protein ComEC/Rec2 [Vicinamibacteria bacterium]|nr:DNA internalization-related competence protein ComEC/Rec2 [Vicinamibacteria bacterium]